MPFETLVSRGVSNHYGNRTTTLNPYITPDTRPHFEVPPSNGVDDSEIIEFLIAQATKVGGVVFFPPGTWYAENLTVQSNVSFKGANWDSTTLKLKSDATLPLFKYKSSDDCQMAGWSNMMLEGLGTTGPDGIDMSEALSWQFSNNEGLRITNFRKGVIGSQNDRRPFFYASQFWANDVGYYVINNHPHFSLCDFRDNNYGISGITLYDMSIDQTAIVRNNYGIVPDTGGSLAQTTITASYIFGNYILGARVNERVVFDGCVLVAGTNQDAASVGIEFLGTGSSFCGGMVKGEGVAGFGDTAILIDAPGDVTITDVYVNMDNFIRTNPSRGTYRRLKITDNYGTIRGAFANLDGNSGGIQGSIISGNTIEIPATGGLLTASDGVIEVGRTDTSAANNISHNTIHCLDAAYAAYAVQGDFRGSILTGNIIRRTAGVNVVTSDADMRFDGNKLPSGPQSITRTGSKTYDPPSLIDGAIDTTTVTVTNAALGDWCIASFSLDLQGIELVAEVTGTNTVTCKFINRTGGTLDIGNGTLRAMVFKSY